MGFARFQADLSDPAAHDPAYWRAALTGGRMIINAAGLLTGTEAAFETVHVKAPAAACAAFEPGTGGVLISAIGREADTPFARWRRVGEETATKAGLACLWRADTDFLADGDKAAALGLSRANRFERSPRCLLISGWPLLPPQPPFC